MCTSFSSFASPILGGEISYTCTGVNASGKNEYDVSVTFYYDCSGNPPSATITVGLGSPTNGFDIPIVLTGGTPVEVSPLCDVTLSSCFSGDYDQNDERIRLYTETGTLIGEYNQQSPVGSTFSGTNPFTACDNSKELCITILIDKNTFNQYKDDGIVWFRLRTQNNVGTTNGDGGCSVNQSCITQASISYTSAPSLTWSPSTGLIKPSETPASTNVNSIPNPIANPATDQIYTLTLDDGICQQATTVNMRCVLLSKDCNQFNATYNKQQKTVELKWSVENSQPSTNFELQRSIDGIRFEKIAPIPASDASEYSYNDAEYLLENTYYYRLMAIEMNNDLQQIWNMAAVRTNNSIEQIKVYPNPANEVVKVRFNALK